MRRLNGRIILRDKDINHVKIVVKKKKKKYDFLNYFFQIILIRLFKAK